MSRAVPPRAAILDVDGTLIDSNDAHAAAWVDVGRKFGFEVSFAEIRRLIGMGGDKVLPRISGGIEKDSPRGKEISARRGEIFRARYLPTLHAFPCARELLTRMRDDGLTLAVASSASREDLDALLRQAGLRDLIEEKTSASDASESKPDPDIVHAALRSAGVPPAEAVMLGDTPYDVEAANRAGVACVALRCGGWGDEELRAAAEIYADPAELLRCYEHSRFSGANGAQAR